MTQAACKKGLPTASALEYRLPVYPVGKDVPAKFSSAMGDISRVSIERGAPRARHRDILDAIMVSASKVAVDPVGRIHVLFDIADVRQALGLSCISFDWSKCRAYLLDLQSTIIAIRRPGDDWPTSWPMLAAVGDAKGDAVREQHQFSAKLKKIVFSEGAAALLNSETQLYLNKSLVLKILALRHQVSRSVARWMVSHSGQQHPAVDDVLAYVGAAGGERQRRKYLQQLRGDGQALAEIGIEFDGEQLHYARSSEVFIQNPIKQGAEPKRGVAEQESAVAEPESGVSKEVLYKELAGAA